MAWLTQIRGWLLPLLAIALVVTAGCSVQSAESTSDGASPSPVVSSTSSQQPYANLPTLAGEATVEMVVNGSPITIQVDGANAPVTAGNFVDLVNRGVYNGLSFHRVVREPQPFVVQGGDPQGADPSFPASRLGTGSYVDPTTNAPRYIPLEIKPQGADEPTYSRTLNGAAPVLSHTRGAVAMARSQNPDSASSQFYFALADLGFLDGNYAVFGYVTDGMDVVDGIQAGDRIESARVTSGLENLQAPGS